MNHIAGSGQMGALRKSTEETSPKHQKSVDNFPP